MFHSPAFAIPSRTVPLLSRWAATGLLLASLSPFASAETIAPKTMDGSNAVPSVGSSNTAPRRLDVLYSSPSRTPESWRMVGTAVTRMDRSDLERMQVDRVPELIGKIPGVYLSQTGAFGGSASLLLRGASSGGVATFLDDISLSDPTGIDRGGLLQALPMTMFEGVELIRGSQSLMYGSGAMAGVLQLRSRTVSGDAGVARLEIEGGSYGLFRTKASVAGRSGAFEFLAAGSSERTLLGFDRTVKTNGTNGEPDKTVMDSGLLKIALRTKELALTSLSALSVERVDLDAGSFSDSRTQWQDSLSILQGLSFVWTPSDAVRLSLSGDINHNERSNANSGSGSYNAIFQGNRLAGRIQLDVKPASFLRLSAGGDASLEDMANLDSFATVLSNTNLFAGGFAEVAFRGEFGLGVTAGARVDRGPVGEAVPTFRLTASQVLAPAGLKFRASAGTGYQMPSVYQRFAAIYGRSNLLPESSFSLDGGIEWHFADDRVLLGFGGFLQTFSNRIAFVNVYTNFQSATGQGIEAECVLGLIRNADQTLTLAGNYTYGFYATITNGVAFDQLRVPRHKATAALDWSVLSRLRIGISADFQSESLDVTPFGSTVPLSNAAFVKLDARASFKVLPWLEPFVRVENILNQNVSTAAGYAAPGLSVYGGVRVEGRFDSSRLF